MPRTSYSRDERVAITSSSRPRRSAPWPTLQLNIFFLIMLVSGGLILGVFADLIAIQHQFGLGIPWLLPYAVTVGSLCVVFVLVGLVLRQQGVLEPAFMALGCGILGVLFLTGVVETGVQMFGGPAISSACNTYITNSPVHGISLETLAWLQQSSICNEWDAAFAFWIVGLVFLIWMLVLAFQVELRAREKW